MSGWLGTLLGTWGAPRDAAGWIALALALTLALVATSPARRALRVTKALRRLGPAAGLALAALVAAALSVAYVHVYLRGGPRIVDATTYLLEARTFAAGSFRFVVPEGVPSAALRGRFLVFRDGALGALFPPGFPAWLSLFVRGGAPMLAGPALALLLTPATGLLAGELSRGAGHAPARRRTVVALALVASVLASTLRYHTADTMSHGLTALGVTLTFALVLRGARTGRAATTALAGLALGVVVATRPVSALAPAATALVVLLGASRRGPLGATLVAGVLPGLALLLVWQAAVAGSPWLAPQRLYYAVADAPADCFRYGFGAGVGCLHEHGDFVRARLPHGYGALEALGTTLRRLHLHLRDPFDFEPLTFVPLALVASRRAAARALAVRAALALLAAHVLAYAPFYFDGNYPGGGARLFADVLPVEHALFALAAATFAPRLGRLRAALGLAALMLGAFALHRSHDHLALRDRDGGAPAFDRAGALAEVRAAQGGSGRALVLVGGDDAFALGHDPAAAGGLVVLRAHGDARDRLAAAALGAPAYRWDPGGAPGARLLPLPAAPTDGALRFEAEAEWPALRTKGGLAAPAWVDPCASGQRGLGLTPTPDGPGRAEAVLELPAAVRGRVRLTPWIARRPEDRGVAALLLDERAAFTWSADGAGPAPPCEALPSQTVELTGAPGHLVFAVEGTGAVLDRVDVAPDRAPALSP